MTSSALIAATWLVPALYAHAEPAPAFPDLLAQSAGAPTPMASAAELDAARARRVQAGAWNNPELGVTVENFGGARPADGGEQTQTTFTIGQTVELGGKRQARVAAAGADLTAAEAKATLSRADYAARLALAYAEAEAASRRVGLAGDALEASETDARSAKLLVEAGKEAPLRSLQASAEADRARADLAAARSGQMVAFARLSALAGAQRPYDRIVVSLLDTPTPSAVTQPGSTAAVAAATAEREAATARLRSARASAFPDVKLSAGVRRYDQTDRSAFVAGVTLPLPIFNRNSGGVAEAQAELRGSEARLRQAELDAEADHRVAEAQSESASARLVAAQSSERAASEAYRLARTGYEAGRLPLLELTSARRALAEARGRTLDAELDRVKAEAELARLSGRTPFGT
ncbi:TolC family protein [Phenylobacterium sp.]|uniref:TolC family protein n=1 Tax=Phenylobacterium sp. TaxID=1871053 RepID=UPI00374DFBD2